MGDQLRSTLNRKRLGQGQKQVFHSPGLEKQQPEYLGQRAGSARPGKARTKRPATSPLKQKAGQERARSTRETPALALEQSLAYSQPGMQLRKARQ